MSAEFGSSFGLSSAGRVDLGSIALPTKLTHFVWVMRLGEGGGAFGRVLGRGAGVHDICNDHGSFVNNYAFGDRAGGQYHRWTRTDNVGDWSSILISGDTSTTAVPPRVVQDNKVMSLTRIGAANFWGTTTSTATVIGNRQSDNARVWDGYIACYCLWNEILNEWEEEQLGNGITPYLVRPQNIVGYYSLDSDFNMFGSNANIINARYTFINPPIIEDKQSISIFAYVSAGGAISLVINDINQSQSIQNINLTQNNTLSVQSIDQDQYLETISLTQANVLSLSNLSQSNTLDNVVLSQSTLLVLQNLLQQQTINNINLQQASTLTLSNLAQSHNIDSVVLGAGLNLAIQSLNQAHSLQHINITQDSNLSINNLNQSHTLTHLSLNSEGVDLVIEDLINSNVLDSVLLTQQSILNVFALTQTQTLSTAFFSIVETPASRTYAVVSNDRVIVINS